MHPHRRLAGVRHRRRQLHMRLVVRHRRRVARVGRGEGADAEIRVLTARTRAAARRQGTQVRVRGQGGLSLRAVDADQQEIARPTRPSPGRGLYAGLGPAAPDAPAGRAAGILVARGRVVDQQAKVSGGIQNQVIGRARRERGVRRRRERHRARRDARGDRQVRHLLVRPTVVRPQLRPDGPALSGTRVRHNRCLDARQRVAPGGASRRERLGGDAAVRPITETGLRLSEVGYQHGGGGRRGGERGQRRKQREDGKETEETGAGSPGWVVRPRTV